MGLDMYLYSRTKDQGKLRDLVKEKAKELGCEFDDYVSSFDAGGRLIEFVEGIIGKDTVNRLGYSSIEFSEDGYEVNLGSWRKANSIHKWFVENVQDGEDDCEYYEVDKDQLEDLYKLTKNVLSTLGITNLDEVNYEVISEGKCDLIDKETLELKVTEETKEKALKMLPTTNGFFFGGTEIDYYYVQDMITTLRILEEAFKEIEKGNSIVYSSSW